MKNKLDFSLQQMLTEHKEKINNQIVYVGALDFTSSYEIEFNLSNSFELSANQKYIMDGVVNYIIN